MVAEVWFMAVLASWWSRQTRSLHSWFNCLCRCWRPYTGSKQWQRQQLNRLQDQAEHQTQVLVGVTVPPPPPLLAVTTHQMGEGDNPVIPGDHPSHFRACQCPTAEWAPWLLLLSGNAQTATLSLPPASPGTFGDI